MNVFPSFSHEVAPLLLVNKFRIIIGSKPDKVENTETQQKVGNPPKSKLHRNSFREGRVMKFRLQVLCPFCIFSFKAVDAVSILPCLDVGQNLPSMPP